MKTKFIRQKSDDLVIFLSGWGCDDIQFKNTTCLKNLLLCWDYCDLNFDFDFSDYNKISLITYSAGVFVAGLIQDKLPKFDIKIAINGNPEIFDKYYGITNEALELMQNLNMDNYIEFRKGYLVYDIKELEYFNNNSSLRSFESCDEELKMLEEYYNKKYKPLDFDIAILSDNDMIFNPRHQIEYFKNKYVLLKNHSHNVFATFKSFDDIIEYSYNLLGHLEKIKPPKLCL